MASEPKLMLRDRLRLFSMTLMRRLSSALKLMWSARPRRTRSLSGSGKFERLASSALPSISSFKAFIEFSSCLEASGRAMASRSSSILAFFSLRTSSVFSSSNSWFRTSSDFRIVSTSFSRSFLISGKALQTPKEAEPSMKPVVTRLQQTSSSCSKLSGGIGSFASIALRSCLKLSNSFALASLASLSATRSIKDGGLSAGLLLLISSASSGKSRAMMRPVSCCPFRSFGSESCVAKDVRISWILSTYASGASV
mmetsp:Transcript_106464/g.189274  ORF Transcript_106464/g.189274 Transcript_106464/m.189274 type:complete len:254 (+) Transcript_106464:543-1304(+)